jgi:hypothetical protein
LVAAADDRALDTAGVLTIALTKADEFI